MRARNSAYRRHCALCSFLPLQWSGGFAATLDKQIALHERCRVRPMSL